MTTAPAALQRRLHLRDAVVIGLGSMIGAGVFAAFAPAARASGRGLLVGLLIAAVVALCNATSSAQLAARYPESGGTYVYGRRVLGAWWGFLAGWSFVIGKTASCAAMALVFASYAVPAAWQRPAAIAAVIVLAAVNSRGVTKTARLAALLVTVSLAVLVLFVAAGAAGGLPHASESLTLTGPAAGGPGAGLLAAGPYGILQAAGLLFFAFAGYARVATLGEEVVDPARTIPRAIVVALAITVVVYAAVAVTLLGALGARDLEDSTSPLADALTAAGSPALAPLMRVGAAVASLGALLGLIAGIGRTSLAMAREGDLPRWLAAVHPRFGVPHRAEFALAAVVTVLLVVSDLRGAIAFSSFGVLLYYFVANVAALRQPAPERRYPRALAAVGAVLCVILVATVPPVGIVAGVAVLLVGVVLRVVTRRRAARRGSDALRDPS
jgi:APA family basic amino acid/polyamine antiporter